MSYDLDNKEVIAKDKQRLFHLYATAKGADNKKTAGIKMVYAKEYLKKYGTLLKVDFKTQYEPSLATVSTEVVSIVETVKVVKKRVEKAPKLIKPKKKAPISGTLVKRIEGIFRYLELLERTNKAILDERIKENEIRLNNFQLKERESNAFINLKNEHMESCRLQNEKLKLENKKLKEELEAK